VHFPKQYHSRCDGNIPLRRGCLSLACRFCLNHVERYSTAIAQNSMHSRYISRRDVFFGMTFAYRWFVAAKSICSSLETRRRHEALLNLGTSKIISMIATDETQL